MSDERDRLIRGLTHLRGAIMHAEAALALSAEEMVGPEIWGIRSGRDSIRDVADELEARIRALKEETQEEDSDA